CADIVKIIRSRSTPALLTRMSRPPNEARAPATRPSPVDHSPTSPSQTTAWPPAAMISSAVSCTAGPGRSLSTSRAPAPASAMASARPSPWPAPVTIAVLPSRVTPSVMLLPSVTGTAQDPAVGDELAAGRVGRFIGGEEGHQPGDLRRLGEPGEGQRLEERLAVDAIEGRGLLEGHPGQHAA